MLVIVYVVMFFAFSCMHAFEIEYEMGDNIMHVIKLRNFCCNYHTNILKWHIHFSNYFTIHGFEYQENIERETSLTPTLHTCIHLHKLQHKGEIQEQSIAQ